MLVRVLAMVALFAQFALGLERCLAAEEFAFHHEHVLGTSLEIRIVAKNASLASEAEARVLAEIDRLARIYSGYDATSEFSHWSQSFASPEPISPELLEALQLCERWHERSSGAFNPASEVFSRLWKAAEQKQQQPEDAEMAAAIALANQRPWKVDADGQRARRLSAAPLSLNGVAKGLIVDRASQVAMQDGSGVSGVLVNIGGDIRVRGDARQTVAIVNPAQDAANAAPLARIHVRNRAIATSGRYRRGFRIGQHWFSHVIDPRTGRPVEQLASATVIAATTADANALAIVLNVLPLDEGLTIADALPGCDYLLVTAQGSQIRSRGWPAVEHKSAPHLVNAVVAEQADNSAAASAGEAASQLLELTVDFELAPATGGGRYRRPYVAIWLEDSDSFPVRTALLWLTTKDPGPRWHRDLLRWYRNDGVRKVADGTDLIGTLAAATRTPGKYKAVFDGKDDAGKPLPAGDYTLYVEVAREHGTYQLIRQPLKLGADPIATTNLKPNAEIKSATFEYRRAAAKVAEQPAGN